MLSKSYQLLMPKKEEERLEILSKIYQKGFKTWGGDTETIDIINEEMREEGWNYLVIYPRNKVLGANFVPSYYHTTVNSVDEFIELYDSNKLKKKVYVHGM